MEEYLQLLHLIDDNGSEYNSDSTDDNVKVEQPTLQSETSSSDDTATSDHSKTLVTSGLGAG